MTETQSIPVSSSQRPFLPCPLSLMPSCLQAAWSKNTILWTSLTNEQQPLPFAHTQNTVSNSFYFLISEKDPVLCSSTASLPIQSSPLDLLCVRSSQWTARVVLG